MIIYMMNNFTFRYFRYIKPYKNGEKQGENKIYIPTT